MSPARRSLWLAGGLLLVLLAAALFRFVLLERFILGALRSRLGLHATVARIEGSVFAGLDLAGVSGRGEPGVGPIASFEARRLSVRYSLPALLRGKGAFLGQQSVPVALYGDRFGALVRNDDHWSLEEQLAGRQRPTQFGLLLEQLGIAFIAAHSPQAKGRIERMWETLHDRLS